MIEKNIFPEYYFINVEKYKNIISKNIDEWIYMLKNNEVKPGSKSKNIDKAEKKLELMNMTEAEIKSYKRYMENIVRERDIIATAKMEGKIEGRIGRKMEIAQKLINKGFPNADIQEITGLNDIEIDYLRYK